MNIDILIEILPIIVFLIGVFIEAIAFLITEKFFDLEIETTSLILAIISTCTLVGCAIAIEYRGNYYLEKFGSYYTEIANYYTETENLIQSGHVVYVNGNIVDSDKIFIRDYSINNIHRNDELKEIYISTD